MLPNFNFAIFYLILYSHSFTLFDSSFFYNCILFLYLNYFLDVLPVLFHPHSLFLLHLVFILFATFYATTYFLFLFHLYPFIMFLFISCSCFYLFFSLIVMGITHKQPCWKLSPNKKP